MEGTYKGNDKLIVGLVLGIITYWLFAQALLNTVPAIQQDLGIDVSTIGIGISLTALFSGIFVVVAGGFVDRFGAVRLTVIGLILSIAGSLLLILATNTLLFITARVIQGFSAACVMPATLSIVKAYYDGAARQRALSFWAIGSWGGTGICSLAGGAIATSLGWRWIFVFSIAVAILSLLLLKGTPETKTVASSKKFDTIGLIPFVLAMLSLNLVITRGGSFGWSSKITLSLFLLFVISAIFFFRNGFKKGDDSFIAFSIFKNRAYSGATLSNFLLNMVAGSLIIINTYLQMARGFTSFQSGLLSIGYLVCILVTIRIGEKLIRKIGARKPMMIGPLVTSIGVLLMAFTFLDDMPYTIAVIIGFILFGIGLGLYATPSTDTAVANSPADKAGVATGIYKMASTLGGSIGIAVCASVFGALSASHNPGLAAMVGLGVCVMLCILSMLSVFFTTPKDSKKYS
jgi:DHA2 family multidrug resistance protein-like MFS transporter